MINRVPLLLVFFGLAISLSCLYLSRAPLVFPQARKVGSVAAVESPSFAGDSYSGGGGSLATGAPSRAVFADAVAGKGGLSAAAAERERFMLDESNLAQRQTPGSEEQDSAGSMGRRGRVYDPKAEPTEILAVIDGDGSGFVLSENQLGAFTEQSVTKNEMSLRNPLVDEAAKVNALAQLTGAYPDKTKEISFLQEIARDLKQPEAIRVGAFLKLSDFGLSQVASFEQTQDEAIRMELDLWKRLKQFERQEDLPDGSLRASVR
jgi:hypothetical protein